MSKLQKNMTGTELARKYRFFMVLSAMCLVWLAYLSWISWQRWQTGDIGIDTAAWAQSLHLHEAGAGFRFTCYPDVEQTASRSMFSIHFYLHLFLLAPLYSLVGHPLFLYLLQHLWHALGGLFLGLWAWRLSEGDDLWALLLVGGWFLYAPLARAQVAFDVNPRHAAMVLFPLAALARTTGRFRLMVAALLLLGAGEENLALLAGFYFFGVAWSGKEHRRWAIGLGICSLLYTLLVLRLGLPSFLEEGFAVHFLGRYGQLRNGPMGWLAALFRRENGVYLLELLGPLAFLPLLSLGPFHVAAIPFLGQNLLSQPLDTRMIGHHYTSPLAVVLFLAVVEGFSRFPRRRVLAAAILGLNLILAVFWYPVLGYLWEGQDPRVRQLGRNMASLSDWVPPESSLSGPPAVCARFWPRARLWFFPQGMKEAEVVVFPRYLSGYPAFGEAGLRKHLTTLQKDAGAALVFQNEDFLVFHRTAGR